MKENMRRMLREALQQATNKELSDVVMSPHILREVAARILLERQPTPAQVRTVFLYEDDEKVAAGKMLLETYSQVPQTEKERQARRYPAMTDLVSMFKIRALRRRAWKCFLEWQPTKSDVYSNIIQGNTMMLIESMLPRIVQFYLQFEQTEFELGRLEDVIKRSARAESKRSYNACMKLIATALAAHAGNSQV